MDGCSKMFLFSFFAQEEGGSFAIFSALHSHLYFRDGRGTRGTGARCADRPRFCGGDLQAHEGTRRTPRAAWPAPSPKVCLFSKFSHTFSCSTSSAVHIVSSPETNASAFPDAAAPRRVSLLLAREVRSNAFNYPPTIDRLHKFDWQRSRAPDAVRDSSAKQKPWCCKSLHVERSSMHTARVYLTKPFRYTKAEYRYRQSESLDVRFACALHPTSFFSSPPPLAGPDNRGTHREWCNGTGYVEL